MPFSRPEEREQDFVPPENAQHVGYYGSAVKGIVERRPGGPLGVDPAEYERSVARQIPDFEPDKGAEDRRDTSEALRKTQDDAAEKRQNMGPGTVRAEDDSSQSPRRERLGQ